MCACVCMRERELGSIGGSLVRGEHPPYIGVGRTTKEMRILACKEREGEFDFGKELVCEPFKIVT